MIVCSFNIIGLESIIDDSKIREVIRVEKVDFLPIQETKMEEIYKSFCHMLWENSNYAWAFHSLLENNIETLSI